VSGRIVLHADMDAFYASIEQRDRPELRGKPVIVGATSARGVVAAASYEARAFGVRSAMPGFRARQLCPDGVYLPSDMAKYVAVSEQVRAVFEELTPLVEPLALDEAFLDVTGSVGLFGGPIEIAQRLKRRVREQTQLAVSCGIAQNKLVAKIACSLGKPDGLLWVPPEQTRALLDPLPIRWLWGIGPVAEKALREAGYERLADVAGAEPRALARVVGGTARARALIALAAGQDERPVEPQREAKSYGEENTFEHDVSAREVVTGALSSHAHAVARRLRHDGLRARTVTIKLKLGRARGRRTARGDADELEPRYPLLTRSRSLRQPTDDGAVIRKLAIALWDAAAVGEPVRLLGVSVSNLDGGGGRQLDLFERPEARGERLGPALDAIRERFGHDAIRLGEAAPEKLTPSGRRKRGQ
jgi:DNA polymerase IV